MDAGTPVDGGTAIDAGTAPEDATVTRAIGEAGGTIALPGLKLVVPADALAAETVITITKTADSAPQAFLASSPLFRFEPAGTTFAIPATLTVDLAAGAASGATLYWTRPGTTTYAPIGSDIVGGKLTARVSHFSSGFVGTCEAPTGSAECTAFSVLREDDTFDDLQLHDGVLFWSGESGIWSLPAAGGTASVITTEGTHDFAVNATDVIYLDPGDGASAGSLRKVARTGGTPVILTSGLDTPSAVTLDATHLYWVNRGAAGGHAASLMKLPIGGGEATTLATGLPFQMTPPVVDASDVFWTESAFGTGGATVVKVSKAGGTPATINDGTQVFGPLAADATHLFWTATRGVPMQSEIQTMPKAGGEASVIASGGLPSRVAVDDTHIYWATTDDAVIGTGSILKRAKAGGPLITIISGIHAADTVLVDATSIYWAGSFGEKLMRATPK